MMIGEIDAPEKPSTIGFAFTGLMIGRPMGMMGFPQEVTFTPYVALRNTTESALTVNVVANYMIGEVPQTVPLGPQVLPPSTSRQLDMKAVLASAGLSHYDGNMNLLLTFTGHAGDLLVSAGSIDDTGNYVFEVDPQGTGESEMKTAMYWTVAGGADTMLSAWNTGNTPEDLIVALHYGDGTGEYRMPLHLASQASASIDMMQLAESGVPDADGHTFSMGVMDGSASFAGATDETGKLHLAISAGVFNPKTATCGSVCTSCCGYSNFVIQPTPTGVKVEGTYTDLLQAEYCTGSQYNLGGAWASGNTGIATVGSTSGSVAGISPGSTSLSSRPASALVVYSGTVCSGVNPSCPTGEPGASGTVNVSASVNISCPTGDLVVGSGSSTFDTSETCTATGSPSGGTFSWSVTGSTGTVSLSASGSSATVRAVAQSSSANDTNIQVQYTVNVNGTNYSDIEYQPITVHYPKSLAVVSDTGTTLNYPCSGYNCGAQRQIVYQLKDSLGPIEVAGIPLAESFGAGSDNCNNTSPTPSPTTTQTDSTGKFPHPDTLALCSPSCSTGACPPPGSCQLTVSQTWRANGISVAANSLAYGCKNITVNGK